MSAKLRDRFVTAAIISQVKLYVGLPPAISILPVIPVNIFEDIPNARIDKAKYPVAYSGP